jgi:hypothetical protein
VTKLKAAFSKSAPDKSGTLAGGASSISKPKSIAGSALVQRSSQVKSPAKTGKISRVAARSAVITVGKAAEKK